MPQLRVRIEDIAILLQVEALPPFECSAYGAMHRLLIMQEIELEIRFCF